MAMFQALDYLYRDAGNYKSFGTIWLTGRLDAGEQGELLDCLESGEFFVAEQICIPALYQKLFDFSDGPTKDDHAWHTFEGLRDNCVLPHGHSIWGDASKLLEAFQAAKQTWKPELSPNFWW